MTRSKGTSWSFMRLLVVGIALACTATSALAQADAARATDQDLAIGIFTQPLNTDPHRAVSRTEGIILNLWTETLVQILDGEPSPWLATSWSVDDSGLVWTFELREDVTFHDGTPLTAESVARNFERIIDPEIASPSAGTWAILDSVEAIDTHIVRFTTRDPFVPFPSQLAHYSSNVINAVAAEEVGADAFNAAAVGTGPFRVVGFQSGRSVTLEPHADYWGGAPMLERIVVTFIPEEAAGTAGLLTGELDMLWELPKTQLPVIEATPEIDVRTAPAFNVQYIAFNATKPPFDDVRVRQAIYMAIDMDAIYQDVFRNIGVRHAGPIGPAIWGYDPQLEQHDLGYDPERARELLAEAGYGDGFSTSVMLHQLEERVRISEIVQQQLAAVGIDLEIDVWDFGALVGETAAGGHDLFMLSWSNGTGDADINLSTQHHSSQIGGTNRGYVDDAELDALIEAQRQEFDPAARQEIVLEALRLIIERAYWIPMISDEWLMAVRDDVIGFELTAGSGNFLGFHQVYRAAP